MANTIRVVVFFGVLLLVQVSCAVSGRHVNVPAVMTVSGFQQGEGGGGPAACDGKYHSDQEFIVSMSSQWFKGGARCGKQVAIVDSSESYLISAMVVDECRDCDSEVGASDVIWRTLHVDPSLGEVNISWSDW